VGFSAGQAISHLDTLSVDRAELESSATARRAQWWRSEKLGAGCGTGSALMMAIDRALQDWRWTLGNLSAMPPASSPIEPASGVAVIGKPQRFAEARYPKCHLSGGAPRSALGLTPTFLASALRGRAQGPRWASAPISRPDPFRSLDKRFARSALADRQAVQGRARWPRLSERSRTPESQP